MDNERNTPKYYRAGTEKTDRIIWEDWFYNTPEQATEGAKKLAEQFGGDPVIDIIE